MKLWLTTELAADIFLPGPTLLTDPVLPFILLRAAGLISDLERETPGLGTADD